METEKQQVDDNFLIIKLMWKTKRWEKYMKLC